VRGRGVGPYLRRPASYIHTHKASINVPGIGPVNYSVAYSGGFSMPWWTRRKLRLFPDP